MAISKLVIVGGVAGGATAAARARRLDEKLEIVVLERGPYVSFANCGLPYHISGEIAEREELLLQTPESLKDRYNLDVRVFSEVIEIDRGNHEIVIKELETGRVYREKYDKLILAPGAAPARPPIAGIESEKIFTLRSVPDMDKIKAAVDAGAKKAVVVGGGFIGLEMVENLKRCGLEVDLVEMLDQVMPPLDREMATALHNELAGNNVTLHLKDAVESFADSSDKFTVTLKSGKTLEADLVIMAIGVKPEDELARNANLETGERGGILVDEHMATSDPDIYAVGDAVVVKSVVTGTDILVPMAGPANRQGRIAADNILGRNSVYRGTQGTGIVHLFNLTAGITGANEKQLIQSHLDYDKVYLHADHHVKYYPGAEKLAIKLCFSKADGRILGAQVTGVTGVDKRIDVFATAIQSGMTVYDLEELELAYAPQYGAAKDPANMAGFVAANSLRGDVKVFHANELPVDGSLIDIRDDDEFAEGTIPGARFITLPQLRSRLNEIPKEQTVHVFCQVGMRGYVAARILSQLGYEVRNLSGGYLTYKAFNP